LTPIQPCREFDAESIDIDLDPLSEAVDPDIKQLEAFEASFANQDAFPIPSSETDATKYSSTGSVKELSRVYPPLAFLLHPNASDPSPLTIGEYRLESPLLRSDQWYGSIMNADALHQQIIEEDFSQWPGQISDDLPDAIELMRPLAEKVEIALKQEQLKEADSMMRMDVPLLAQTDLVAPWDVYGQAYSKDIPFPDELSAQKRFLRELKNDQLKDMKPWLGASTFERHMIWKPFSDQVAKNVLVEKIDQGECISGILSCMTLEGVVTSDSQVWKQEGLRILDDFQDEEEFKPAVFNRTQEDVEALVRKRKAEMVVDQHAEDQDMRSVSQSNDCQEQSNTTPETMIGIIKAKTVSGPMVTAGHLSRFLALKGIQTPAVSPDMSLPVKTSDPRLTGKQVKKTTATSERFGAYSETIVPLELPPMPTVLPKRNFIISTQLIQTRRTLYRRLEQLYPTAEFVERDFTSLVKSSSMAELVTQRQKNTLYDPAIEADIILSPSTGLVLTNFQKIQQVSLPGAGAERTPFHERICQLSVRYEHLVILVSQTPGQTRSSRLTEQQTQGTASVDIAAPPMTVHDVIALARLNVLADSLPADTMVQLVVGGESELAGWAAFYMSSASCSNDLVVALEESLWEQILRRAGMNCFAACVVLSTLGRGEASDNSDNQPFGLPTFIQMRPDERVQMFAGVFGGENVLKRVNACLERAWMSECRGFK
jgi:hypothetical protein